MIFKSFFFFYGIKIYDDLWYLTLSFNNTGLIYAVYGNHREIVELLLRQEGIDINMKDFFNQKFS